MFVPVVDVSSVPGDFVIDGGLEIQWQYGHDRAHQDCDRRPFLGSFGHMLLRENFCD